MMSRCATPPQATSVPIHCPSPLPTFRNLGADLAGVIFTCTEDSLDDCLRAGVFGLPRTHFQYVQHVRPSMVLFLFNFSTRELHGIFRAITGGKIDGDTIGVNPDWAVKFPAQVCVDTSDKYPPLPETAFRRLIAENYMSCNSAQFSFELDMEQVARLSEVFKQFAVHRTTPIPPTLQQAHAQTQNVLGSFPAPSPTNMAPFPDRPSQAWLNEKTRRLSPVGRRPGLEFLNFGRPRSSMDYLTSHPQHFETDLSFMGGSSNLQAPRLSIDVNSFSSGNISTLNTLLSANSAGPGNPLLTGVTDPLSVAQSQLNNSRLFQADAATASGWKPDGVHLPGIIAQQQVADASASSLYTQAQLGVLPPDNTALAQRMSVGRLSPGHLSPDMPDTWNADVTANAFKMAVQRLTPDINLTQAAAGNISLEEAKRPNIWTVNSKDMGLVDPQRFLSGMSAFPEVPEAGQPNAMGLQQRTDFGTTTGQEASRLSPHGEGMDPRWNNTTLPVLPRKPPRPHSSTDGEVQSLTQNLATMWSESKPQLAEMGDGIDLYPPKSSSRVSVGKGYKTKENNVDEQRELSDGTESESGGGSAQDKVNIGVLEADSNQYLPSNQTNGDSFYTADAFTENQPMSMLTTPEYYPNTDIGIPRGGKQLGVTDAFVSPERSFVMPNPANIGIDFGLDGGAGHDATAVAMEELTKVRQENEQLKIERNQLQKQINNAMKKKTIDHTSSNSTPKEGAMMDICFVGGALNHCSVKVVNSESIDEIKEIALPVHLSRGASVSVGEHLYYIGGVTRNEVGANDPQSTAYHIDHRLEGGEAVKTVASMREARQLLGAVSIGMKIFAMGGRSGPGPKDTVEIYDPLRDRWVMGPSLNTSRHSFGTTVVNNAVYAVGGFGEKGPIQSVERLDAREGRWIPLGSLSWSRAGLACCPIDNNIFAVGGHNGRHVLSSAEILDLRKGIVMECIPTAEPRQYGSATLVGDNIIIVGGVQDIDTDTAPRFSRPEIYNTATSTFSVASTIDTLSMVFHSASSVSCYLY